MPAFFRTDAVSMLRFSVSPTGARHRGVHDHRHAGGLDLVHDQVGLGGAVEHELELELLGEAQRGEDVLGAVHA